uniref:Uncharacterized protein n=2 Tax=Ursus TaxID=9639 RepID=A0A452TTQ0_URSMA
MAFLLATCRVRFVPSVQDFTKKLIGADAYLQILIEHLKLFDDKLQNCKDKQKIETLKETNNMGSLHEGLLAMSHCLELYYMPQSILVF